MGNFGVYTIKTPKHWPWGWESRWLPSVPSHGNTLVEDTIFLPVHDNVKPGSKSKPIRKARQGKALDAAQALERAQLWQSLIDSQGMSRADIARREGISRARVTQIMSLLTLPAAVIEAIKSGKDGGMTIRQALKLVK